MIESLLDIKEELQNGKYVAYRQNTNLCPSKRFIVVSCDPSRFYPIQPVTVVGRLQSKHQRPDGHDGEKYSTYSPNRPISPKKITEKVGI